MPILASLGHGSGGDEELRFSHLTFQEYLVAVEISDRVQHAASEARPLLLRQLLRQSDRHCAALAVEEPRWHVVLETCAEMLGTALLGQALLWSETHELQVGTGARMLLPYLELDRTLITLDVSGGDLDTADVCQLADGVVANDALQQLTLRRAALPVQEFRTGAHIDLNKQGLCEVDGIVLGTLLRSNTVLAQINVSANTLGESVNKIVLALAQNSLTSVAFAECEKLQDDTVKALASACTQLTSVNFQECSKLTDDGVTMLVQACTQLTFVNFYGCGELTDVAVKALTTTCASGMVNEIHLDDDDDDDFGGAPVSLDHF